MPQAPPAPQLRPFHGLQNGVRGPETGLQGRLLSARLPLQLNPYFSSLHPALICFVPNLTSLSLPQRLLCPGAPQVAPWQRTQSSAGDVGLIPGLGRSPGKGNDNPFQYSCLKNPMDRGAWWFTVHGVAKNQTQPSVRAHTHTHTKCVLNPLPPNVWAWSRL